MFVTLFNLQGAHRSQRREFILPCRFVLVKNFFQVFQNFLELFLGTARPASLPGRPRGRPTYIITAPPLCQALFSNLFRFVFALNSLGRVFSAALADSFDRIPPSPSFVKNFFQIFFFDFRPPLAALGGIW